MSNGDHLWSAVPDTDLRLQLYSCASALDKGSYIVALPRYRTSILIVDWSNVIRKS